LTDWVNTVYRVAALDANDNELTTSGVIDLLTTVAAEEVIGYFKASNTDVSDLFGEAVALSADGNTLAVGVDEDSAATGINGDQSDNSSSSAGAVYLY
jgi:hypothetical protein